MSAGLLETEPSEEASSSPILLLDTNIYHGKTRLVQKINLAGL